MFYPARFQPPMLIMIQSTGNVSWNFPASISTLCQLDLRRFPYDQQTCTLNFIRSHILTTPLDYLLSEGL